MSDLLTIKEAASYLRMSPLTLYRMASKGILPAVKVGRHWRIVAASKGPSQHILHNGGG